MDKKPSKLDHILTYTPFFILVSTCVTTYIAVLKQEWAFAVFIYLVGAWLFHESIVILSGRVK